MPSNSRVSRSRIRQARTADLYGYLESRHAHLFKKVGHCLCMRSRDSIYIKKGVPGFMDFSTGNHGNAIDFLKDYLGYGFLEAVDALTDNTLVEIVHGRGTTSPVPVQGRQFVPPSQAPAPFLEVHEYLGSRGIPAPLISRMENKGILYQELGNNNAVFINPQHDYCEIRGTYGGAGNHFHSCRKTRPDRFWYILNGDSSPQLAYICESAIDAVSLMLLRSKNGNTDPSVFISIGGVYNQKAIDRVKKYIKTVIAVDNDAAGAACRDRNSELASIIPTFKDWNDDLLYKIKGKSYI